MGGRTAMSTQTMYRLRMPWTRPPLSANGGRGHHMAHAKLVAEVRLTAGWVVKAARIPACERVTVGLVYVPATRRRRDGGENYADTLKAVIDGVVDAGVVPDDTPEYVIRLMPVVAPVDRDNHGVFLTLEVAP